MKKINILFVLIFLCGFSAFSSAVTVRVSSPVSGSTVTSPVTIKAFATSGHRITGWWVYVDGAGVYSTGATSSISPSISMSAGKHNVIVRAWNSTGSYASQTLTLTASSSSTPPPSVSVSISPSSASLQTGASTQFAASVSGSTNTAVTWMVNGTQGGNSTVGTISTAGVYTAPAAVPSGSSATVTAKSVVDPTKSASAAVSIVAGSTPVSVSISPTTATVQLGQTKQFAASVTGTTNTGINWQVAGVTGGNSTVGLISSTGLYTAPLSAPATNSVTVTARSAYDSTASGSSAVTLTGTSSTGKDYYVSPTGSDSNNGSASSPWKTINRAASLVTAGYTVHVAPGTYTTVVSTSPSGTASARIRYVSDVAWGAHIVTTGTADSWTNNGSFVDIVGFDISGSGNHGILNYGSNVVVQGNYVHDILVPNIGCSSGGAAIDHANYSAVNDDTIGNLIVRIGNTNSQSCAHGIYHAMNGGKIQNNIVGQTGNVNSIGIQMWHEATNVIISNNVIFNCQTGILIGSDGLNGLPADYTTVTNNILYSNSYYPIREYGSTGTHNIYANNLLYGNALGILLQNGNTATSTVTSAPQFVNYQSNGTGDYHLQSTSPAKDKGTSTGAPSTDFDGYTRPYGATYDIGAYEWHP